MPQPQEVTDPIPPNWWRSRTTPVPPAGYAEMIDAARELQDRIAAAVPDEHAATEATIGIKRVADLLARFERDEWSQISGFSADLPGRGSVLLPLVRDVVMDDKSVRGRVRFGRFHLGGNGAAHGGTIPLVFDDLLGRLSGSGGRTVARTAYLHVDYRSITPVEKDLDIEAWFVSEEGRKRILRGTLRDGTTLCAEAEGLFVQLRPGQH
ncbi:MULTISPECIES: PaaI family thioesterase [unclassified Nocardia]|uniref:PaaI family thioesterase n=1 Tax=unclassified Nocardia TaxID=2637762 RepID=UPI0036AE8321